MCHITPQRSNAFQTTTKLSNTDAKIAKQGNFISSK